MKITVQKALALRVGLAALDGYDRVAKDGAREVVVKEYYKFGGGLRLLIAKNANVVQDVLDTYQKARNALIGSLSDDGVQVTDPVKLARFQAEDIALQEAEQDAPLANISVAELRLEVNPIPASVLAVLGPLLSEGA